MPMSPAADGAIAARRMVQQQLWDPPAVSPGVVVRRLAAVQAQEFAYARWSLAQRCAGVTCDEVMRQYSAGTILRTHVLRPTWHFVHRLDLGWLLQLSAPRVRLMNRSVNAGWGVDEEMIGRSNRLLAAAVAGGEHRTRQDLSAVLTAASLPGAGIPFTQLLMAAELDQELVSGAPRLNPGGTTAHTYAAFGHRVPPSAVLDRDEALGRLAVTYFASRGPATVKDCAAWSGLTMTDIRRGLALTGEVLERVVVNGREYFQPPDGGAPRKSLPGRVDLIQCYDEYVMGYSATRFHLGGKAPTPGRAQGGIPSHLILVDGLLSGHWKHELTPGSVTIHVHLRRDFPTSARPALESAAHRYSHFLAPDRELRLTHH